MSTPGGVIRIPPVPLPAGRRRPLLGSIPRSHALAPPTRARRTKRRAVGLDDQPAHTQEKRAECPPTFGPDATPPCAWPALIRLPAYAPSRFHAGCKGTDRRKPANLPQVPPAAIAAAAVVKA